MESPLRKIRDNMGWTENKLAHLLGKRASVIGKIEHGKMRIPDSFYDSLRALGVDPFKLAIEQENFIAWRRKFYSALKWGLKPENV